MLTVSGTARVTALSLILHDTDFGIATMRDNLSGNFARNKRRSEIHFITLKGEQRFKRNSLALLSFQLLDGQNIAHFDEVLLATGFNYSIHIYSENGRSLAEPSESVNPRTLPFFG